MDNTGSLKQLLDLLMIYGDFMCKEINILIIAFNILSQTMNNGKILFQSPNITR